MPRNTEVLTAADIETFVRKLKATVALAERGRALEAMLDNLRGGMTSPRKAARPSKPAGRPAKRPRTRQAGIDPEKALTVLKAAKEPMSVKEVAAKLGEKSKPRVAAALKKLRSEKKAVLTGEKALARWSAT